MSDVAAAAPTLERRAASKSVPARILADGAVIAVIAVWWLASRSLPEFVLPSPLSTAKALAQFFIDPSLAYNIASTFVRVVTSVVLATIIGIVLAAIPYYVPLTRDIVRLRILPLLNAMPSLGWAILAVIWFGVTDVSVVFAQTAILIPFCFINVSQGIDEMDRELLEMAHSFTRRSGVIFRAIIIPLIAPSVMAAARLAYGVSWKISLISELFGSETGLGYVMYDAQTRGDAAMIIATCLMIVILFTAGDALILRPLQRAASPQNRSAS
jgi:NitT/TauT family transport system permease protein/sulfonate transport system permease protein